MIDILFNLLPVVAGILVAVSVYRASSMGIQAVSAFRMRIRRLEIVRAYQLAGKASVKRVSKQVNMAKLIVGSYGDRLVKDRYRSKLEQLLVNSGDWENKKYSTLVQRKIIFAVVGFSLGFFLLLIRNIQLAPIFIAVVFVAYFLPDVERFLQRITGIKYRNKLENLLDQAGNWKESDYFSLIRRKIIFALNSFIVSYLYLIAKDKSFGSLLFSIFAIFMGFFIPDILLQNRVIKRKEMLADTLPDAIDMLQMCVSAGLAFPAALSKVADTQNGPVAEEFARVTAEVQLGQSRSDALAAMAERTQEEHVQKFVSAMMQVDRFGIPVGNVLIEQSKEMRSARRERARERGQKVPVKILAPIMLCFLPTVLMIILGPAVISIMRAFGSQ
ncbi:unannotated protein [freshwater metagenome]|uniref:Unannotated protein n=1 Tax=freshwater metagenome TaxID=449393 RepID=A0A6J6P5Z9_9ZZZZ|nr:hypothetical protein [Actinomycetota bacterium]MSX44808.1 hypothetical protein [Actinomycetota bacterium]MSX73168.1 hypothetical protein [Actinomycetota bacterium]MSZ00696.1 hypothetical protein [Actinomycetota bacterium]MTA60224.1 hypothetical protein [Actinomycetota bacterium]